MFVSLIELSNRGCQSGRERAKDIAPIARTEQVLASAFGVRHQSEDIAFPVTNSRNVITRAVWVGRVCDVAVLVTIAKDDAVVALEFGERRVVTNVVAFSVCDRNTEHRAALEFVCKRTVGSL